MGNQELAIRFTEETYATRSEIAKVLGSSVVDAIWTSVLAYRGQFTRYLAIKTIDKANLSLVLTPTMLERINGVERRLTKAMVRLARLNNSAGIADALVQPLIVPQLLELAKFRSIEANEKTLTRLMKNPEEALGQKAEALLRYYGALKDLAVKRFTPFSEDTLATLYSKVTGNYDLVTLYREQPLQGYDLRMLGNKLYNYAPADAVEELMTSLAEYLKVSELSPLIKATLTFYYIHYLKPFDQLNEELSVLLFKTILTQSDFETAPVYLALERVFYEHQSGLKDVLLEVQKTSDITYLISYVITVLDKPLASLLDLLVTFDAKAIDGELRQKDPAIKSDIEQQLRSIKAEIKQVATPNNLAMDGIPLGLDEVQANQLEMHLLESNPAIKKMEAHFYARHCTIGKFYTIAQFKKLMSCAYETARTSMDHLTELGYYRKEQYKNKYIYTPLSRK